MKSTLIPGVTLYVLNYYSQRIKCMRPFSLHSHLLLRITVEKQSLIFWGTKLEMIHLIYFKNKRYSDAVMLLHNNCSFPKQELFQLEEGFFWLCGGLFHSVGNWNIFRNPSCCFLWCQSQRLVCLLVMSFYHI